MDGAEESPEVPEVVPEVVGPEEAVVREREGTDDDEQQRKRLRVSEDNTSSSPSSSPVEDDVVEPPPPAQEEDPVVAAAPMEETFFSPSSPFSPPADDIGALQQHQPTTTEEVPRLVFLVPYRDRVQQRAFFQRHMTETVLAGVMPEGSYQIWFVHQCDARRFNRGAMKNIGVRIAQDLYHQDEGWRDITFVFNDVDTMPFTAGFFDYEVPQRGVVKHFFGFTFALGGIVSMRGHDFDLVNGFPNLWAWGYEDNTLQERCVARGVVVDRSVFYPIMDKSVMQFPDGKTRSLNRAEYDRYMARTIEDGLYDVFDIEYHELLPQSSPEDDASPTTIETHLLPGVRQFEVTAFSTTVPEPTSADDELDFGKVHPYRVPVRSPVFSVFGNMLAAKQ